MIPAYKTMLFTSLGCSLYMMGRLVLVRVPIHMRTTSL